MMPSAAGTVNEIYVAEILRIETRGERGRADEIAEHYRQLPAFPGRRTDHASPTWSAI